MLDNFVPYLQPGHKIGTVRVKTRKTFNLLSDYCFLENALLLLLHEIFTEQRTRPMVIDK